MRRRYELTDHEWSILSPLLPNVVDVCVNRIGTAQSSDWHAKALAASIVFVRCLFWRAAWPTTTRFLRLPNPNLLVSPRISPWRSAKHIFTGDAARNFHLTKNCCWPEEFSSICGSAA